MGELIILGERLADRSRAAGRRRPAFFFDLACPFSYLTAERVERLLGEVDWVPVCASAIGGPPAGSDPRAREAAARLAAAHRLPLVWPDGAGLSAPSAMRAASFATEAGAGARFALAAGRLAFCGGFELEDPETLTEAAAAAGLPLDECLQAAGDPARDGALAATGHGLQRRGVRRLPALAVGRRLIDGQDALIRSAALLRRDAATG
jgi:2-hydroxychromene-2-carboxylate isomerase